MPTGQRRISPSRSWLGAIALLGGAALYWGWPEVEVEAAPEVAPITPAPVAEVMVAWNQPDAGLTHEVRRVVRSAIAKARSRGVDEGGCHVSVLVQELGVPGALVELDADRRVRPASNLKVATTAVALALLGAHANFETRFESETLPDRGVLRGDLVVRAGGDPLYREGLEGECAPLLASWVQDLRDAGVRSVAGDVVLDVGCYADPVPAPGWPSQNQHWKGYCALAGGFSANGGCVSILVEPSRVGRPARVRVHPLGHGAGLDVDVMTGPKGSELDVKANVNADPIRVWGRIPADVLEWDTRHAHRDPVELFASVLGHALRDGGVQVGGTIRRERHAVGDHVLATLKTPVVSVLSAINTHSNNAVADQLFFKVGADVAGSGDRGGGSRAIMGALVDLGLDPAGYQQVDGSGLSRDNRLSARQLVCLLDAAVAADDEGAQAFMGSLALSGISGTLADRMTGTVAERRVRAKTGFIGGTSALSGVAITEEDRLLVFSILVEYPVRAGLNSEVWKPMQDSICEALVRRG